MRVELVKRFEFEAAHATPWQGDAARLHGHSFVVDIAVSGECDPYLGWLVDYAEISQHFDELYRALDHKTLETVAGMTDATLGGVRAWIVDRLRPKLPTLKDVRVTIRGERTFAPKLLHADTLQDLPERVRFGFEAAHALRRLPPAHKCHTMHGHSFIAEVGADRADDIAASLFDVYDRLDHRCLNDVLGIDNPTSEETARWIWNALAPHVPGLSLVSVAETCTAKCLYRGERRPDPMR
jgi:6-pyruvoyltetrahydropterin/6-carboxytetrahydropterin synthase